MRRAKRRRARVAVRQRERLVLGRSGGRQRRDRSVHGRLGALLCRRVRVVQGLVVTTLPLIVLPPLGVQHRIRVLHREGHRRLQWRNARSGHGAGDRAGVRVRRRVLRLRRIRHARYVGRHARVDRKMRLYSSRHRKCSDAPRLLRLVVGASEIPIGAAL